MAKLFPDEEYQLTHNTLFDKHCMQASLNPRRERRLHLNIWRRPTIPVVEDPRLIIRGFRRKLQVGEAALARVAAFDGKRRRSTQTCTTIMRTDIIIAAAIAAVALTPSFAASQQTSPYETDICPIPAGVRGYTIVVRPEAGTNADTTYLKEIANQAGGFFTEKPTEPQQAAVLAVVDRDGRLRRASLVQRSGSNRLDRGALSSIRQAFEHSTALSPSGFTADSLVIRILFGEEPREGESTFRRFSAQHRLPEFVAPRGRMVWPADLPAPRFGGVAMAWIEFDEDGTASLSERRDPIQATDPRFIALVQAVVPRLRFVPGQSNCEPQAYELPVRFDFSERTHVRLEIVGP